MKNKKLSTISGWRKKKYLIWNCDSVWQCHAVTFKWLVLIVLNLTLRCKTQQLWSALSSAGYFKSHCCKQCGPRSDCSFSSLIWVHIVCLYAKSMFEKFARRCSRRHKQTTQQWSALSSAGYFKSHCWKQCGPRSDCSDLGPYCLPICKKYVWTVCKKMQQTSKTDNFFRCRFSWYFKG